MTASQVEGTRGATYRPGQILVSLADLEQVVSALRNQGANPTEQDRSLDLGLALLSLGDPATPLHNVADGLLEGTRQEYQQKVPPQNGDNDLDRVLAALRAHFESRPGGRAPTVGKNRLGLVGGVDGIVQHNQPPPTVVASFAGGGYPTKTEQEFDPPTKLEYGQGVTVGVLDTGIAAHPWLEGGWTASRDGNILPYNFPNRSTPYRPEQGHATFIAGLILNQAQGATVRVRPVLNEAAVADNWEVAKAIVEFGKTGGLDIMNLSFACYTEDGLAPLALSTAIDRLDPNIVVVAAAGNHGNDDTEFGRRRPAWPAALDRVVAVGATDGDQVADFTPEDAVWIDLYAPGVGLLSTYLNGPVGIPSGTSVYMNGPVSLERDHCLCTFNGWAEWSGTSFAAALISGEIAKNAGSRYRRTAREALDYIRERARGRAAADDPAWKQRWVRIDAPSSGSGPTYLGSSTAT